MFPLCKPIKLILNTARVNFISKHLWFVVSCHWMKMLDNSKLIPHFGDEILRCHLLKEKFGTCTWIKILLMFVSKCPFNSKSTLVEVMAQPRIGNKSLTEPSVTQFIDVFMHHRAWKCERICQFGGDSDYRQISNIRRTPTSNKTVDHSDVVGASPVGAAPTTSSFSTQHSGFNWWGKDNCNGRRESFKFWD